ncbi:hypothetical protein CAURIC_10590 [Corynebacterium auriscanis]|nr:hypothetical protein CAURIC_10590 [Corynebacterium auriscanis]
MLLARGAGEHRDQLPAVLSPVIQDLLGGMCEQRHGCVFPFSHASEYNETLGQSFLSERSTVLVNRIP